jgi:8-oxo-dGTP pyrophosphatase MutT (NUDIX family)
MKSSSSGPSRWEKLADTILARTRVFNLHSTRFRHPARNVEQDFVTIQPPDWVNVIAVTPDERIVLVRQFRFGIDGFSLEIPGGMIDAGEDPVTAGVRELREETGFVGSDARLLGCVHPNPAIQTNRCHFLLVENAVASNNAEWDDDEEIAVSTESVAEVLRLARSGGITHALVLDALFLFEAHWKNKELS